MPSRRQSKVSRLGAASLELGGKSPQPGLEWKSGRVGHRTEPVGSDGAGRFDLRARVMVPTDLVLPLLVCWSTRSVSAPVASSSSVSHPMDDDSESFVLVDSAGVDTPSFSPMVTVDGTPAPYTPAVDSPVIAHFPTTTRACRPYGHAHKPPACIRAVATPPAAIALPSAAAAVPLDVPSARTSTAAPATPSSTVGKRSFAEIIQANSAHTPSTSSTRIAYAQDAKLSLQDQVFLARIEQLTASSSVHAAPSTDSGDEILDALTSIQYDSPALKPMTPLTHEQRLLYDEATSWTLGVDEPNSKRAKRVAVGVMLTKAETQAKLAKKKGKSKNASRAETLAVTRARDQKAQ